MGQQRFNKMYARSETYMPCVRNTIAEALELNLELGDRIRKGTTQEDTRECCDLVIWNKNDPSIAIPVGVRVREPEAFEDYLFDWTIRTKTENSYDTEYPKIFTENMGKYYLYGFSDGKDGLLGYGLYDLDKVRELDRRTDLNRRDIWKRNGIGTLHILDSDGDQFAVIETIRLTKACIKKTTLR